ncbi:MAG: hypothetical protein U9R72_02575 [Chloroflexota bacterium]|nr:hypothetical protein [Chloroflexota bacterium]
MSWLPWLGLAVTLVLLLVIERWIHRHLQGTMLLLSGDREIAVVLYALPLMPGIVLHEVSHALTAKLLGVRAGHVSVRPKLADERVQLGFVPVEETDFVRASLIGLAPLLTGSAVILSIGYLVFGIGGMQQAFVESDWATIARDFGLMLKAPDLWLWIYLVFTVSNTMLPSRSDRQSWMPILLFIALVAALAWAAGLGPTMVERLGRPLDLAAPWLTAIYAFTIVADLPFVLVIALLERILGQLKGVRVEY